MNNSAKIVIIIVALGGAAALLIWNMGGEKPGALEGRNVSHYICSDPECATEFEVRPGESIAPPTSQTEICPTCKTDWPHAAAKCTACGRMHIMDGHGVALKECPHCDAPMPELKERLQGS